MDNFDFNAFFNSKEFDALDDASKSALRAFAEDVSEKTYQEAFAVFLEHRGKLNVDNEKKKALLEAVKAGMSTENRAKAEFLERLMSSYKL